MSVSMGLVHKISQQYLDLWISILQLEYKNEIPCVMTSKCSPTAFEKLCTKVSIKLPFSDKNVTFYCLATLSATQLSHYTVKQISVMRSKLLYAFQPFEPFLAFLCQLSEI